MKQSFSQRVKNEIIEKVTMRDCCAVTFLATAIMCSDLALSSNGAGFSLLSTNLSLVKLVARLVDRLSETGQQCDILCEQNSGKTTYTLTAYNDKLLYKCGILCRDEQGLVTVARRIEDAFLQSDCCRKTYAQALFLCCGSVVIPLLGNNRQSASSAVGYRLELTLRTEEGAIQAVKTLNDYNITPKMIERKSNFTVYLQDADSVSDMLILLDASNCLFEVEDLKIERSLRNTANRQTNCEVANITKSAEASLRQIEAINYLIKTGNMNTLDDKLQAIANLRLDYPDANIAELATRLGITKSGAVHRINKLLEIAIEKRKDNE